MEATEMQDDEHGHCHTCCRRKCSYHQCPQVDCEQPGCPARFHSCKMSDHLIVCQMLKVPCINKVNGCPLEMLRGKIASHLKTCPASVIFCPAEWNRWPMHSTERGLKSPMPFRNPHVKCGQLDVAFAMQDQHVLMESLKAPLRTRRILRNPLTPKYPVLPIPCSSQTEQVDSPTSSSTSQTVSDDDSDAPWNLHQDPPGLQQSVFNQLKNSKLEVERMTNSMDYVSGKKGLARLAEVAKQEEAYHKKLLEAQKSLSDMQLSSTESARTEAHKILEYDNEAKKTDDEEEFDVYWKEKLLHQVLGVDLRMQFLAAVVGKPPNILTFKCAKTFRRDEFPWHVKNVHSDIQTNLDNWFEQRCPLAYQGCTFSFQRFKPKCPTGSVVHSTSMHSLGFSHDVEQPVVCDTSRAGSYQEDIQTMVGQKRLREATPEIYTSVACDSAIKVHPRYNSVPPSRETSPFPTTTNITSLNHLPFEVLQNIARHLDGFSINSLSMTCRLMQSVCCSLLDERGIVSLVWEKQKGEGVLWVPKYKKWQFSMGFTGIKEWEFCVEPGIVSEHLKVCPYNQAEYLNIHTEPQKVMMEDIGQTDKQPDD